MNICFNALNTNLGPTGGCYSIVESATILRSQGHVVDIVATKNRMTYNKPKTLKFIPKCDVCIAISTADIDSTIKAPATHKAIWIRGPEWLFGAKWFPDKEKLLHKLDKFTRAGGKILTNSQWLTLKMFNYGFQAKTCFVGMDFNRFKDYGRRTMNPTIGCLFSKRESKRFKDFLSLQKILGPEYRYRQLGGKDEVFGESLTQLYNACDFWIAPSELEGFHKVPAEAALCGCYVVGNDNPKGGTGDWLFTGITGHRYKRIQDAAEHIHHISPEKVLSGVERAKMVLATVIGSKDACMIKLLEAINED